MANCYAKCTKVKFVNGGGLLFGLTKQNTQISNMNTHQVKP